MNEEAETQYIKQKGMSLELPSNLDPLKQKEKSMREPRLGNQKSDGATSLREPKLTNVKSVNPSDLEFKDQNEYLDKIAQVFDTKKDFGIIENIVSAVSNNFMSTVIIEMNPIIAQSCFEGCEYLIRCYRDSKKFFEMPIEKKPIFIDIFDSILSYILEEDEQAFYSIDVGSDNFLQFKAGQAEPRKITHDFDQKIIGFKLGHMMAPESGNVKAVFWSEEQLYMHAFNPIEEHEEEVQEFRKLVEIQDEVSVQRILDFGVRQERVNDYEEEIPEFLLLEDQEGIIKIMKGSNFGSEFISHKSFKEEQNKILKNMILIDTYKLAGVFEIIQPEIEEKTLGIQIFEIEDVTTQDEPKMTREFKIAQDQTNFIPDMKTEVFFDRQNKCVYFRDYKDLGMKDKKMIQIPINNNISNKKINFIELTPEVAMNIIALSSKSTSQKMTGIIFKDFLSYENICVLLHGKVVSCFDLVDRNRQPGHGILQLEQTQKQDFYNFELEPKAIWMADKPGKSISSRWKMIVAFNGGHVKELKFNTDDNNVSSVTFEDYLVYPPSHELENQACKLPGTILKIMRNRNNSHQQVYFIIRRADQEGNLKKVLATIEFQTGTYREFEIQGLKNEFVTYLILDFNDEKQNWQEIIAIESIEDKESQTLEQNLYYCKIRVGKNQREQSKEIVILNHEILQPDMENVQNAKEIYVCGKFIYFIHRKAKGKKAHIERYNFHNNKYQVFPTNTSIMKFMTFDNKFFYWRTRNQGKNSKRHISCVYFDNISTYANIQSTWVNKYSIIFSGSYPHLKQLQYDSLSESIACFTDFTTFKVFPLLQNSSFKVKASINKDSKEDNFDGQILSINLYKNQKIVTLHQANILKFWNLKTGMLLDQQDTNINDLDGYVWQQRIDDQRTLIRSRNPIKENDDDPIFQNFPENSNFTDKEIGIKMFKYRIIYLQLNNDNVKVNVIRSFIGPHIMGETQQGIYAGDELDLFIFLYNDGQDKMKIKYLKLLLKKQPFEEEQTFEEDGELEKFYYMKSVKEADQDNSKLSIHSPNFKKFINKDASKNYVLMKFKDKKNKGAVKLPKNLNENSFGIPNFLTNSSILFQTKDKIIKSYNYKKKQEDFIYSNCAYPGVQESIDLASIIKTGPPNNMHVVGENTLTYFQTLEQGTIQEYIAPNAFNHFFVNSYKCAENKPNQYEMKLIQNQFKSKIELDQRSISGYYFKQVEYEENYFKQELHIVSTFSFYHWRILSLIKKKKFDLTNLTGEDVQNLLYFQLDDGTTILHAIYKDKAQLENIISKAQSQKIGESNFYVPFFKDLNGQTALDLCLNVKVTQADQEQEQEDQEQDQDQDQEQDQEHDQEQDQEQDQELEQDKEQELNQDTLKTSPDIVGNDAIEENTMVRRKTVINFNTIFNIPEPEEETVAIVEPDTIYRKSADYILSTISTYPFDLFKIDIQKLIPHIIKEELIGFQIYMQNCTKTPIFIQSIDRAKINVDSNQGAVVFEMNEVWSQEDDQTQKKKFENGSIEQLVELQVVDIPFLHHSKEILEALSEAKNQNLFKLQSVKALIEQKWDLTIKNVVQKLLIPYALFMLVFMLYTINDFETSYAQQLHDLNPTVNITTFYEDEYMLTGQKTYSETVILRILIICFDLYFIFIEAKQMMDEFWMYIKDYQNYIDMFPLIIIIIAEIMNLFTMDHRMIRTLYSITALVMWLRFIYFFRIVKSTNFYMKLIVNVILDATQFFFVFFISIFAFGHAIYIFSLNYNGLEDSSGSYYTSDNTFMSVILDQYMVPFGEYQQDDYNLYLPAVSWFFFILQSLIVIIVLLNLLISIVGDTFARVNADKSNIMYRDMVDLIVENYFLINSADAKSMNKGKYLVLVIPEDSVLDEEELNQQNFDQIKALIRDFTQQRDHQTQKTHYKIDRNLFTQKDIQNDIQGIMKKLNQMDEKFPQGVDQDAESFFNSQLQNNAKLSRRQLQAVDQQISSDVSQNLPQNLRPLAQEIANQMTEQMSEKMQQMSNQINQMQESMTMMANQIQRNNQ